MDYPTNQFTSNESAAPCASIPEQPQAPIKKTNVKLIAIIAAIACVAILLVVILTSGSHGFSTPEEAAIAFIEGSRGGDPELTKEAMHPEFIDANSDKVDALLKSLKNAIERDGDKYYNFTAKESTHSKGLIDNLEEFYWENDTFVTVEDAYVVKVRCQDREDGDSYTQTVNVAKIDGEWYAAYAD